MHVHVGVVVVLWPLYMCAFAWAIPRISVIRLPSLLNMLFASFHNIVVTNKQATTMYMIIVVCFTLLCMYYVMTTLSSPSYRLTRCRRYTFRSVETKVPQKSFWPVIDLIWTWVTCACGCVHVWHNRERCSHNYHDFLIIVCVHLGHNKR